MTNEKNNGVVEEGELPQEDQNTKTGGGIDGKPRREDATTFYVTNIPAWMTDADLWTECRNLGWLVDAYIAKKKDTLGRRFGFLRFAFVRDADKLVKAINMLDVKDARLKANVAKFNYVNKKMKNNNGYSWQKKDKGPVGDNQRQSSQRQQGESRQSQNGMGYGGGQNHWKDALLGNRRNNKMQQENIEMLHFHKDAETCKEWIRKSFVGCFKDLGGLKKAQTLRTHVRSQGGFLRFTGGLSFIATFNEEKVMLDFLEGTRRVWEKDLVNLQVWEGQVIPYQRVAWLSIKGVPLQLWCNSTMNEIAGRYGRVISGSTADTWDLNLAMDVVGVLVHQGKKIEEKIGITWKGQKFDVWVSEINESWAPSFISKAEEYGSPEPSEKNDENRSDNQKKTENQAAPVISSPVKETNQGSSGEHERSGEVETSQGSPRKEEAAKKPTNVGPKKTDTNPNTLPPKGINERDNHNSEDIQVESQPEEHVDVRGNTPYEFVGPAQENHNEQNEMAHKKRKRNRIADVRNNALKPYSQVRKHKGPDISLELSDESRLNPRKKTTTKMKFKIRRNKTRGRLSRDMEELWEDRGHTVDDEYDSDWQDESESDCTLAPDTNPEYIAEPDNTRAVNEEIKNTEEAGEALGIDMTRLREQVTKVINDEQVDVMKK
ncbi:putative RNA recognition motif domain, nucleotide-binding alpha-beta plait domain superfamily [Helianthus annuus]|nr:putative RNA recognition motif domain, nucleotide-binding alpha-beta plait domain superfamily [Helianthus annuus]